MIEIIDFSNYKQAYKKQYGGASCRKYDIQFEGNAWFLKFPGNVKYQVNDMSYSNSSVSEYVGSHIYETLGYEVHETILGIYGNKCVVACKDFIRPGEFPMTEFSKFKTTFLPGFLDSNGNETNGNGTDLEEIVNTLVQHPLLAQYPELKQRFWDMFVVDAFIGNNDRNNGNWGLIENMNGEYRLSPVYDNGSSFLPKTSQSKMEHILADQAMFKNVVYSGYVSVFEDKGHRINPLKYITAEKNKDCIAAIQRNVPRIKEKLPEIIDMINTIPEEFKGVEIISPIAKKLYSEILSARYNQVLLPIYEKTCLKD